MRATILNLLSRFRRDEAGVTLVEYAIALTVAVTVGLGGLTLLGNDSAAEVSEAANLPGFGS